MTVIILTVPHKYISIHALHGEGDGVIDFGKTKDYSFQSTPSTGRATFYLLYHFVCIQISIHALHGEGDFCQFLIGFLGFSNFNPRPPRGGRPVYLNNLGFTTTDFNPRPPRGGRPSSEIPVNTILLNFNPRPPRGGRLMVGAIIIFCRFYISIHALHGEGDPESGNVL